MSDCQIRRSHPPAEGGIVAATPGHNGPIETCGPSKRAARNHGARNPERPPAHKPARPLPQQGLGLPCSTPAMQAPRDTGCMRGWDCPATRPRVNPGSREEPGVPARGRSKQRAIKSPRSHHHTGQMHYTIEVICVCVGGCVRACIHVCMYNSFRSHSARVIVIQYA